MSALWLLQRMAAFLAPVMALAVLVPVWARPFIPEAQGPGTEELVRRGFEMAQTRHYDCLVVGNSRVYRGLNPDKLGVPAYNFAQDNDSFNQIYYKLRYLEAHDVHFRTLVIGVDYSVFSIFSNTRNFAYERYLGPEYLRDYAGPVGQRSRVLDRVLHPIDEEAFNVFMTTRFTRPASRLLAHALAVVTADAPPPQARIFLRDNGQRVVDTAFSHEWDLVRPDPTRLPIQVRYFRETLEWARTKRVAVVLVMPPVRDIELRSYAPGVTADTEAWLQAQAGEFGARFLNYASDPSYTLNDFSDVAHLNEAGADKFSMRLGQDLAAQ